MISSISWIGIKAECSKFYLRLRFRLRQVFDSLLWIGFLIGQTLSFVRDAEISKNWFFSISFFIKLLNLFHRYWNGSSPWSGLPRITVVFIYDHRVELIMESFSDILKWSKKNHWLVVFREFWDFLPKWILLGSK